MMMNLKLKDGLNPNILEKYGFKPKYNCDTGEVEVYGLKIDLNEGKQSFFSFELRNIQVKKLFRQFSYGMWMTCCAWNNLVNNEFLAILFALIKDDIVELVTPIKAKE